MKPFRLLILAFSLMLALPTWAHLPKDNGGVASGGVVTPPSAIVQRTDCAQGSSSFDLGVNNVRARLLICGDSWWDLNNLARYVVPNVPLGSGLPEVSSLFAGAVWLGGKDPAGNLLLAAQTYRSNTRNDFWPGPLDTVGNTSEQVCNDWDKHFSVTAEDISTHIGKWTEANAAGTAYDCSLIPENVRGWPAKGNPYFFEVHNFALPNTNQGLALFFDQDNDGLYNPCNGDYPVIDIRGCELKEYPDQMIFWIYNDNGGIHTQSQGSSPIRMEVQVQAFAYATNDQLNDMTFMRYKLINRSVEELDSTYFAVWTDPDLGCPQDDYIGCDTSRSLAICYNQDNIDGVNGSACTDGIATYGEKIPIIGIDYFRGPRDTYKPIVDPVTGAPILDPLTGEPTYEEIGMTSFTYYGNGGLPGLGPATGDPQSAQEYYNYMTGKWRDGTPVTFGASGYNPGSTETINYVYPGDPSVATDWTMCEENLPGFDGRTVQASGPFKLPSGAINELIIGMPWVPNQNYACPSLAGLQEADDISQALFDNCFDITDGPDAPCISYVELDRELIIALTNDLTSNNYQQGYQEIDLSAPNTQPDTLYNFEGYIVYQLRDPSVTSFEFNDPDKARIVYQVDLKNDVSTLYNWDGEDVGLAQPAYVPSIQVQAANKGVNNTFRINQDAFALGEVRELKNHKKYYFAAIAYAHNNWKQFDPSDGTGQSRPFLAGRRNIGDKINGADYYTLIPRPITDRVLNASYGGGDVLVSRLEGFGTDNNFLDVTDATRESFLEPNHNGTIPYIGGRAPIKVNIFNPLDIKDGEFELTIKDGDPNDNKVSDTSRWIMKNLSTNDEIISDATIEGLNEQLLNQYGFSISIAQGTEPGQDPFNYEPNGYIGTETDYREAGTPWLNTFTDGPLVLDFMQTGPSEFMFGNDPNGVFSNPSNLFVPYQLCSWIPPSNLPMIFTPAWQSSNSDLVRDSVVGLSRVNNVDIVFTRDKSKWSRCVVVETTPPFFYGSDATLGELNVPTTGGQKHFDLRNAPSVGKEDADGDGLPDADGALETFAPLAGQPMTGMGWFPGYAVDVETGRRLNIFFGEATAYNQASFDDLGIDLFANAPNSRGIAHDMMWNPSSDIQLGAGFGGDAGGILDLFIGGHQYVYVTDETYDGCDTLRNRLDPKFGASAFRKISALKKITWAGIPYLPFGASFLSYADGLIPNEMVMKLRVENKYNHMLTPSSVNGGNPTYRIKFDGVGASALDAAGLATQLNMINVVPNPYYGYSPYETSQFTTTVKITNLPSVCTVTIYSLDGKFIKQYNRNEGPTATGCSSSAVATRQTVPDLEWDLRNYRNIPIASGVYLINVKAPGVGERTLKWFGTNRQFDPSGL